MDKKIFSAFYGFLGEGHSKIAVFSLFCPYRPKGPFFAKFQLKISQRLFPMQTWLRYGKSSKIDKLSENVAKKGFSHPKPQMTKLKIFQISKFWVLSFAVLGAFWVRKALFSNIFGKLEKFKWLYIPWPFLYGNYSLWYFDLKFGEKGPLGQLGQNRPKNAIFECPANKFQKPIPKHMVQDRYYHRLIA